MAYAPHWEPQTGNLPKGVPPPERSLGYGILRWCEKYLLQPDGENAGKPWRFTKEQKRFILWAYAIDDRGRWLYDRISLRRAKGWGKTPLLAALAIIEFIGPCRFGGWGANGLPIAVPHTAYAEPGTAFLATIGSLFWLLISRLGGAASRA